MAWLLLVMGSSKMGRRGESRVMPCLATSKALSGECAAESACWIDSILELYTLRLLVLIGGLPEATEAAGWIAFVERIDCASQSSAFVLMTFLTVEEIDLVWIAGSAD